MSAILLAMRQRATIVLTGFGPFPGMPENVSARLVRGLANLAQRRFPAHRVVARILPTEWQTAPQRIRAIYERERPKLALHFGVSERARGFVIETVARNVRAPILDAAGNLPTSMEVAQGGPARLPTQLPIDDILSRLTARGVPAIRSEDAGGYLCNTVFYCALVLAAASEDPLMAGFIHVPHTLGAKPQHSGRRAGTPELEWDTALPAALEIIRTCLGRPPLARRRRDISR